MTLLMPGALLLSILGKHVEGHLETTFLSVEASNMSVFSAHAETTCIHAVCNRGSELGHDVVEQRAGS